MKRGDRAVLWVVGFLVAVTLLLAVVLHFAAPRHGPLYRPPIERGIQGQLGQWDARHKWPLWRVDLGEVYHEAGAEQAWVKDVRCFLYAEGERQLIVTAPWLLAKRQEMELDFSEGVEAFSAPENPVGYYVKAGRLVYMIPTMLAQFFDNVRFRRGGLELFGSRVDLQLARGGPASCVVEALPPRGKRRLAIAVLALGAVAAAAANQTPSTGSGQTSMDFRNASIFANRLTIDWATGEGVVTGHPKLETGRLQLTADRLEFKFDDQRNEVVTATATGEVELVAQEEAQDSRKIRAKSPRAVFNAEVESIALTDGVQAVLEGETDATPGTMTAQTLTAYLRQKRIIATGGPVRFEQPASRGGKKPLVLLANELDYTFDGTREFSASGSPRLTADEYEATGSRIVARTAAGSREISSAEFVGPVVVRQPSKGDRSPVARAGMATYNRDADSFVLTQGPTMTIPSDKPGEEPTVLTADTIQYRGRDRQVVADGNPTITAREGTRLTGSRMVAYLDGDGSSLDHAEVEGPVEVRREDSTRNGTVIARAGRAVYNGSTRIAQLVEQPEILLVPLAGQPESRLTAERVDYNTRTGELSASGQPTYVRGDTRMTAGAIAVTVDPDTRTVRGGEATGGIQVRALIRRADGTQRLAEATAEKAELSTGVRVPDEVPGSQPGITTDRIRLTGKPEIRVSDFETHEQLAYFHNIEVIDLYVRPKGVLLDVYNPAAPTVLEIVRPKEGAP